MAKQAGKFAPVFDLQDPQTAAILGVGPNLAGFGSAANLGTGSVKDYQTLMAGVPAGERESFLQYRLMSPLFEAAMRQFDPNYQEEMLKRKEKYDTKRGFKSLMFNQLSFGYRKISRIHPFLL